MARKSDLTIRLGPKTRARIDRLAEKRLGRKRSTGTLPRDARAVGRRAGRARLQSAPDAPREIITSGMDDLEDYYLGLEALERVRKGEPTVSGAELRRELGLDD